MDYQLPAYHQQQRKYQDKIVNLHLTSTCQSGKDQKDMVTTASANFSKFTVFIYKDFIKMMDQKLFVSLIFIFDPLQRTPLKSC